MWKEITLLPVIIAGFAPAIGQFTADWDSLDSRVNPQWFDESKIGIFLHWGVFSVPSFGSEWFWEYWQGSQSSAYVDFMNKNYRPGFTYQDFASLFTAEFYDPDEWADIFAAAGARYVVLTSKHHEGYTMWPSTYSWGWNAKDTGPNRDLLGDLAASIRNRTSLRFGLYHSLYEWFNPLYLRDKANNFATNDFVTSKMMPELIEITNTYLPDIIWSDGDWEADDAYFKSKEFLAWLFNDSPVKDTVLVNDRWGIGDPCVHGSYYTCSDRFNPGVLQPHKWENCMTLDKQSWGYRREAVYSDYLTIEELLSTVVQTISCGGNILVNAGPTHDGKIPPVMEERLRQMGTWLGINGEAVYASNPWINQNDTLTPGVWYTCSADSVFAFALSWPQDDTLTLGSVNSDVITSNDTLSVSMLGYANELQTTLTASGLQVNFPLMSQVQGTWVWVLKIQGVTISRKV